MILEVAILNVRRGEGPEFEEAFARAQAIIASDETIKRSPQLIQKIVRATLKGMKDIMADPAAAAVDFHQGDAGARGQGGFRHALLQALQSGRVWAPRSAQSTNRSTDG